MQIAKYVSFCPIPPKKGSELTFAVAGKTTGLLVWRYSNGDILCKTEGAFFYLPKGSFRYVETGGKVP